MDFFLLYAKASDDEDQKPDWAEDEDEDGPLTDEDSVYQKLKEKEDEEATKKGAD